MSNINYAISFSWWQLWVKFKWLTVSVVWCPVHNRGSDNTSSFALCIGLRHWPVVPELELSHRWHAKLFRLYDPMRFKSIRMIMWCVCGGALAPRQPALQSRSALRRTPSPTLALLCSPMCTTIYCLVLRSYSLSPHWSLTYTSL